MSSPMIPTAEQLSAARLSQWHQNGEALLTFENLRSWMNVAGLVLFTPRASQLPAPAPSFVEAVLGAPTPEPTLSDTEQARSLLARLVAEGLAVPLNLLGTTTHNGTDTPDFVVSAPVFSYIFTLRGDKAWKQPPATSGAVKVSPLAAAAYEILTKRPMMTAYDLTTELGKEVTESAVLRALNELWSHLRVLPITTPNAETGTSQTLWELTGTRFTKQIKAGANAGQPSALSALISLYLGSSLLASEEEIETFLSPLAPRSRIRDVVHALMGARELETLAVEGRTLLHVSGSLPAFITPIVEVEQDAKPVELLQVEPVDAALEATDAPRISKFVAKPRKIGTGFPSDFGRKFNGKPLDARDAKPERQRRPFDRSAKPTFNKPWEEDRKPRPAASGDAGSAAPSESRPYQSKPRFDRAAGGDRGGSRPAFGRKPAFGARPSFGGSREGFAGKREGFTPRPSFRREEEGGAARPPRREFTPRPDGDSAGPRKTFSKPGTFGRKREGFAGRPSFGDSRPPRRDFSDRGPSDRSDRGDRGDRGERPSRPFSKPAGGFAPRTPGSFSPRPRPQGGFGAKPFGAKPGFSRDRDAREGGGDRPARPTFRKFDAPRTPREGSDRSERPSRGDGPARPYSKPAGAGFGAKKPFGKSDRPAGRPANTFTKFADGKNPFRKPGKPGGKAGSFKGKSTSGSFDKPVYRKRKPGAGE